jgi:hypothetical protein
MTIDAASAPDTNSANAPAGTMVVSDSRWMPWATPDTAERMNAAVSTTMIVASTPAPGTPSTPADGLHAAADLERAETEGRGRAEQRRDDARMSIALPIAPSAVFCPIKRRRGPDPEDRPGPCGGVPGVLRGPRYTTGDRPAS